MANWDEIKRIKENKSLIIAEKKSVMKQADACDADIYHVNTKGEAVKAEGSDTTDTERITAKIVINTTNLIDSHCDCHIPGLWNKTLKENKSPYHLQEHQLKFDKVISDQVTASVKTMSWASLGQPFEGNTQALIFDSIIEKERNEYMFKQYLKGWVRNHSVGMRYVNLFLCINSEERYYQEEKDNWDKYYPQVANKSVAEELGYFWAVTEAKMVEGSAVPIGSNYATPTISVKSEPSDKDTHKDSRETTISKEEFTEFLRTNLNN